MREATVEVARLVLIYTSLLGATFGAAACVWLRRAGSGAAYPPRVRLDAVPRIVAPHLFLPAGPSEPAGATLSGVGETSSILSPSRRGG